MHRIRLRLPKAGWVSYRHLDLIHDAIINGLIAAGASAEQVIGTTARPWNFATLGFHHQHEGRTHGLIVSTPDQALAEILAGIDPTAIRYARASTGELCDFGDATVEPVEQPFLPESTPMGVLALSPIAISDRTTKRKQWQTNFDEFDLSAAVNARLSRIAGRPVELSVQADSLYLRANPKHSVLVSTKRMKNGRSVFVIGMQAPLVLAGSREDLLQAWYTGIGEKTRNGFGCIGLAEDGVGR